MHRLVRVKRRGAVGQVCGHYRMLGIRGIDHLDTLAGGRTVISIVGAHVVVRRSILGKGSLIRVLGLLAYELQIAVVGGFGIAAETFLLRRLALQSAFRMVGWTTGRLGDRPWKAIGGNVLRRGDRSTK